MFRMKWLGATILLAFAFATCAWGADHPGNNADCASCHNVAVQSDAPKVIPEDPGFIAKTFQGMESFQGHQSVSCVGSVTASGSVSGCHDISKGLGSYLVMDLAGKPVDALCGVCHPDTRELGLHHPSYKVDKDGDGVAETFVRPAKGQEVYTGLSPVSQQEPLRSYPDAMAFMVDPEGQRRLKAVVPLATITENDVQTTGVVTCVSCHNPHFGFLVELQTNEQIKADLVARESGDALLRMRDHDNALCLACH